MIRMFRVVGASMFFLAASVASAADATPAWKPLFNGKNLQGWTVHYASKTAADAPPPASLFAVANGEIRTYPTQAAGTQQPNAYIETVGDYKDYRLSLEYKWGEKKFPPRLEQVRDAGLLYNVHREIPANWPASFEVQI